MLYMIRGTLKCAAMQMHPTLEAVEDVLANLFKVVDNRGYVSVGRGLWDCTSQAVYEYLEGLQEGLGLNRVCSGFASMHECCLRRFAHVCLAADSLEEQLLLVDPALTLQITTDRSM